MKRLIQHIVMMMLPNLVLGQTEFIINNGADIRINPGCQVIFADGGMQNAVQANIRAMFSDVPGATGRVYNIAFGERTTINELYFNLKEIVGSDIDPTYRDPRKGDVRDSLADISKAKAYLDYNPEVSIKEGLHITIKWFAKHYGPTVTE